MMESLKKEEYVIRPCTSCGNNARLVDLNRIRKKLDDLFDKKDFDEAERLINYWLKEVNNVNDYRTELELQNEYIGFLRKLGRGDEAITHAKRCDELIDMLGLSQNVSGATIYLNIATVYKAFGKSDIAVSYFLKAKQVYDNNLKAGDKLFSGLFNNMALALVDIGQFDAAEKLYREAIDIILKYNDGELDAAISYLNLADLYFKKYKTDPSDDYTKYNNDIEKNCLLAWKLLNKNDTNRDAYYRFVCEKCAPSFGFYGYFIFEKELKKRANER